MTAAVIRACLVGAELVDRRDRVERAISVEANFDAGICTAAGQCTSIVTPAAAEHT